MNIRKISIGLLFLILALVVVPGSMAATGTHPSASYMQPPSNAAGEAACVSCHLSSNAQLSDGSSPVTCGSCHSDPYPATLTTIPTPTPTATPTSAPVTPGNNAPVANDQAVTTSEGTPVAVTLNATDADGNTLNYTVVSNPAHGNLSGIAPALTYTPDTGYNGSDSFTFKANDGTVDSNTATVSITVTPVTPGNSEPVANNQSVTTIENTSVAVTLTATGGNTLTYTVVSNPVNGTLSGTAPALNYTPDNGFNGTDSFTFKVNNGTVDSNIATVSITVTPSTYTPELKTINVSPSSKILKVGQNESFLAETLDQFNQTVSSIVTWASSNTTVGTIDTNGNFSALAEGTTVITATNGTIYGSANVTVSNNTKIRNHHHKHHQHRAYDEIHENKNGHEDQYNDYKKNSDKKDEDKETD